MAPGGQRDLGRTLAGGETSAMRTFRASLLVSGTLIGTLTAGCASYGSIPPPGSGAAERALPPSATEQVVYSFAAGSDGKIPSGAPVWKNGGFYGTTVLGGNAGCTKLSGCGIVYAVSASGQERVLHAFAGGKDGEAPNSPLLPVRGSLLGTTTYGGTAGCKNGLAKGCGTIFEVSQSGNERVLYRFLGGKHGALPTSALTPYNGEFYGEASGGGAGKCYYADYPGCGLIFKTSRSGRVSVVYRFNGGKDGGIPQGGLLLYKGNFYGTTSNGGSSACYFSYGCGTVFRLTPAGTLTTLHRFTGSWKDGALPSTGLVMLNGKLYGTTFSGGSANCGLTYYLPCGTVFEVSLSAKERIVHNFTSDPDGQFPNGLTAVGDNLYGTTESGGAPCPSAPGCGIVYALTPSGEETILYTFKGTPDAGAPSSALIDVNGTLYGVSQRGGADNDGAVYSIAP